MLMFMDQVLLPICPSVHFMLIPELYTFVFSYKLWTASKNIRSNLKPSLQNESPLRIVKIVTVIITALHILSKKIIKVRSSRKILDFPSRALGMENVYYNSPFKFP